MSPEEIERAILDWFADHCSNQTLAAQIRSAVPGEREVTNVGFFTALLIPESIAPFAARPSDGVAFEGCGLFAPELEPYADCILHSVKGRISSLEVCAIAEGHPLQVTSFEVRGVESNFVDLRHA